MHRIARIPGPGKVANGRFNVVKLSTIGANTFYDSQSGSFITKPGSGGVRIHDSRFKYMTKGSNASTSLSDKAIVDYIREASSSGKVTSLSLPNIESTDAFEQYMSISIPYLIRNRQKLTVKVASQLRSDGQMTILNDILQKCPQAKEVLETEIDILVRKLNVTDSTSPTSALVSSSATLATKGLITRANLYFNIDPFIHNREADVLTVIEVGEIFASLCDVGVKVINICLCSGSGASSTALTPRTSEAVLDYLREIIEEGLNLDVSGDALLERFSVQCVSERVLPGVVELALSLGITRFVSGGLNSGASGGASSVSIGSGSVVVDGSDKLSVLDTMPLTALNNLLK